METAASLNEHDLDKGAKRAVRAAGFLLGGDEGAPVWDNICTAAFWLAASMKCSQLGVARGQRHTPAALYGARSQRDLTQALVCMSEEERKTVFLALEGCTAFQLKREWRSNFYGAFSVVRVARCLADAGLEPIAPLLVIDMRYKIDLFARLDRPELTYLCLQIKSSQEAESVFTLATAAEPVSAIAQLQSETRRHVARFQADYQLTCIPAVALVSYQESENPWEIEPTPSLTQSFCSLLEQLAE